MNICTEHCNKKMKKPCRCGGWVFVEPKMKITNCCPANCCCKKKSHHCCCECRCHCHCECCHKRRYCEDNRDFGCDGHDDMGRMESDGYCED